MRELFGDRGDWSFERENLEITAFKHPHDYATHFKDFYGPTIVARANAEKNGKAEELDRALDEFTEEWNKGSDDEAYFEQEYLVAVGTRA